MFGPNSLLYIGKSNNFAEIGGLAECLTAEGDLRTLPSHLSQFEGIDGFYAARLQRAA